MMERIVKAAALRDVLAKVGVPLDQRPARWIRQVTKLEVRDVK